MPRVKPAGDSHEMVGMGIHTIEDVLDTTEMQSLTRNFRMSMECTAFANKSKPGERPICKCGRPKESHSPEALSNPVAPQDWGVEKHTTMVPTTTFGSMSFESRGGDLPRRAVYLRVSSRDHGAMDDVVDLVKALQYRPNQRKYKNPSLIISVTGAALNFDLSDRLREVIKKGLMSAAETTDAWVVTGGTASGVMQLTGEIMKTASLDNPFPVIGIATWGIAKGRADLAKATSKRSWPVSYSGQGNERGAPLDENHNIFLLVDDGRDGEFGGETQFRASFESAASGSSIPVVTVVIQGGPGTIDTCHSATKSGTPLVVVAGTGQAADILVYAHRFFHGEQSSDTALSFAELRSLVAEVFPKNPEKVEPYLQRVVETVAKKDKVHVFDLNNTKGGRNATIHEAILSAVIKGGEHVKLKPKLMQAMRWERKGIAQKALAAAAEGNQIDELELEEAVNDNLMAALKFNQPNFVELFLKYNAKAHKLRPTHVDTPTKPSQDFPGAMNELFQELSTKDHLHPKYIVQAKQRRSGFLTGSSKKTKATTPWTVGYMALLLEELVSPDFRFEWDFSILDDDKVSIREKENLAYHVLMMYCVLQDKFRLARMFWLRGDQSVPNALVASRILQSMSLLPAVQIVQLADEREKMLHNSGKFETLAVGVMEQCQKADNYKTGLMLHRKIESFKNKNAIEVAFEADNKEFISHPATQGVINADWFGLMAPGTSKLRIWLAMVCPLLLTTLIHFKEEAVVDKQHDKNQDITTKKIGYWQRIRGFYDAPIVRFWIDAYAWFTLLLIYSFSILRVWPENRINDLEWVLAVWIATLFVEELRQLFSLGLRTWFKDAWNKLDMFIYALFYVGFVYRLYTAYWLGDVQPVNNAKAIFAIEAIFMWFRLLRYYTVSEQIGPKLIILGRMMSDVTTFVALLFVFLASYGIAAQVLLFPDLEFGYQTLENILYRPYFQIYGELFLEQIEEDSFCIGPWQFSDCGFKLSYLIPILLGLYLLATSIVLVNLLIAMFNQTYERVEEQSRQFWHMQNFELYLEYKNRPLLPAPAILLSHIHILVSWLQGSGPDDDDDDGYPEEMLAILDRFQEANTDTYNDKEEELQAQTEVERLKRTEVAIHRMGVQMLQLQHQNTALQNKLDRVLSTVTVVKEDGEEYEGFETPYVPPRIYPRTNVRRCDIDGASYEPEEFESPVLESGLEQGWADPPDWTQCKYNQVDGKVNRVSMLGTIKIGSDGRPLNPMGRTGLRGRGELGKWGVNHAVDPIVTRWKRDAQGAVLQRNGQPVLEFVAIFRLHDNVWALPGGFVDNGMTATQTLIKEFREEALNSLERSQSKIDPIVERLFRNGVEIQRAFSKDPRTTDNAWVETTVYNFHDEQGYGVGRFQLQGGDDAAAASWKMVHRDLHLFANHVQYLEKVARMHKAFW